MQRHFCSRHTRFGTSGPIITSRGRVITQPLGDVDCSPHWGHQPSEPRVRHTPGDPPAVGIQPDVEDVQSFDS